MDVLKKFKLRRRFWAVGSSYGGIKDQTNNFLAESKWVDGWALSNDNRDKEKLDTINIGDILVMKSSSTKGHKHSIPFTRLKAIGIVEKRINYYSFVVTWLDINTFPIDFDGIIYRSTIEEMRDDDILRFVKKSLTPPTYPTPPNYPA